MFEEQITRGAALLDQRGPVGWRDRLDLAKLELANGNRCVLGQLYGTTVRRSRSSSTDLPYVRAYDVHRIGYVQGVAMLGGPTLTPFTSGSELVTAVNWGRPYGFSTNDNRYDVLTGEWREYVGASRELATVGGASC